MSALAFHPESGGTAVVTQDQMIHLRAAGWVLQSEWDEAQAQQAAAKEKAAAKPGKSEGK